MHLTGGHSGGEYSYEAQGAESWVSLSNCAGADGRGCHFRTRHTEEAPFTLRSTLLRTHGCADHYLIFAGQHARQLVSEALVAHADRIRSFVRARAPQEDVDDVLQLGALRAVERAVAGGWDRAVAG